MVGLILGGGNSALSNVHGMAIDNVLAFEGITASGETIKIDRSSSTGEEIALFNVLCGAGYGLLVVTSVTMLAYPLSGLQLDDKDKLWIRRYTFPGKAIEKVAEFCQTLLPVQKKLMPVLICARAPPTAPVPGAPMLILSITYYGPSHVGQSIIDPLVTTEFASLAIATETVPAPFTTIFDSSKMLDRHGGFKAQHVVRAYSFSTSTIIAAFNHWKQFGDQVEDARAMTMLLFWGHSAAATVAAGEADNSGQKCFAGRDRPLFGNAVTWYTKAETQVAVERYVADLIDILRTDDDAKGLPGVFLPNNSRNNSRLEEMYTKEMLDEIRRIHAKWNPDSLFYNVFEDDGH
jgi:hypothetical protein